MEQSYGCWYDIDIHVDVDDAQLMIMLMSILWNFLLIMTAMIYELLREIKIYSCAWIRAWAYASGDEERHQAHAVYADVHHDVFDIGANPKNFKFP